MKDADAIRPRPVKHSTPSPRRVPPRTGAGFVEKQICMTSKQAPTSGGASSYASRAGSGPCSLALPPCPFLPFLAGCGGGSGSGTDSSQIWQSLPKGRMFVYVYWGSFPVPTIESRNSQSFWISDSATTGTSTIFSTIFSGRGGEAPKRRGSVIAPRFLFYLFAPAPTRRGVRERILGQTVNSAPVTSCGVRLNAV